MACDTCSHFSILFEESLYYLYLTVILDTQTVIQNHITNDQDCVDTGDIRLSVLVNTGPGRGIASVRAEDMVCRSDDNDDIMIMMI